MLQYGGAEDRNTFQGRRIKKDAFVLDHYKALKKYLMLMGLNPYKYTLGDKIRFNVALYSMISSVIPMILQFSAAIREKDFDGAITEVPHVVTMFASLVKFVNISLNRKRFKTLLDFIVADYQRPSHELRLLDKVTAQGSKFANLYRTMLLSFLVVFVYIPLLPITLDMIMPLNESRPRQQAFEVNYIVMDVPDHFFIVYFHITWSSIMCVITIVGVDCLYMIVIHHAGGLFDICGYRVEEASKSHELSDEQFKQCVVAHHRALEFFECLQECSRSMNLMLVGINMIGISTTAVEIILHMDRPADTVKFIVFLIAQKFHLLVMSLNGQILVDHACVLPDKIYNSNWYNVPVKFQKFIYTMIIRCNKTCVLSAGGLYDMNMENFGKTVKACMSYFTMFLSLRE